MDFGRLVIILQTELLLDIFRIYVDIKIDQDKVDSNVKATLMGGRNKDIKRKAFQTITRKETGLLK